MRKNYTSTQEQRHAIENQFARFALAQAKAEPRDLPRTYGFEIETPDADQILSRVKALSAFSEWSEILDFKPDGSVSGADQDCECDCSSCTYHECNCDNCGYYNDDPEHDCGNDECYGQYQEITSIGGTLTTHPRSLDLLDQAGLQTAEVNESCGLHVHIGSADLTPAQVASVITAYRVLQDIMTPLAEREPSGYCHANTAEDSAYARQGHATDKYKAVNTAPHFRRNPQTIEFRQHAGTNSTYAVRAWAVLLVALVEYAKAGKAPYWLARCADFDELARELGIATDTE